MRPGKTVRVAAVVFATAIVLALAFSAGASASGGTISAWGYNRYGEVGNGTATESGCYCVESPVPVTGISDATQVTGGEYQGLTVLSDGTARSWGYNYYGELGDGTTSNSSTPVQVKGLSNVVAVAGGAYHSLALLANGTVMAWGYNEYGQLGTGSTSGPEVCGSYQCSTVPLPVAGISNAVAIAAGYYHSYALLANGTVMAWGYNYYGQNGDGKGNSEGCECVTQPVAVPGVTNAIAIAAGEYGGVALLADGTVKDWGYNEYGQAGNGISSESSPCYCTGPVTASNVTGATSVGAGAEFNMAGLSNGNVMAWGGNEYGQLATGSTTGPETCGSSSYSCSRTPIQVGSLANVHSVSAYGYGGAALLADGTGRGWGYGDYGELGYGTPLETKTTPVTVSGVSGASAIGTGEYNGYALIGPKQTLNISLAGSGTGSVRGREVSCPPRCSGGYPQGQVAMLTAASNEFAGFSGVCSGTGTCQARMDSDQSVTATFGIPKGTAITAAKINSKKKNARFSFAAPGAITGFECMLVRPKAKKKQKKGSGGKHSRITLKGGKQKKPKFAACGGPKTYKHLKPGAYTFRVRALDILGHDATPAKRQFKIKASKKKHHKHG
jgi:alpha-tubulin suppressor-like RCC1 family protein